MSGMSSLAAQLAGLNSASAASSKNVGSVHVASTRHEDAIGRGMHHSVQLGHSVILSPSLHHNPKFKPSVIYPDAKAASDVPLSTLWENCKSSLEHLQTIHPPLHAYLAVCQDKLQQQRRGQGSKGEADLSLIQLFYILSSLFQQDDDSGCSSSCLHVLEYLLRRYDVHVHYADSLLMTLLPHSEPFPVLFFRLLQLIDVANANHWIWLRPYSVAPHKLQQLKERNNKDKNNNSKHKKKNANDTGPVPPPRQLIAKHVIQNTALLHQLCITTRTVATQCHYTTTSTTGTSITTARRGVARILSWSATVLVQGLVHLQTVETSNHNNKESVLRVLLPFVLQSAKSHPTTNNKNNAAVIVEDWTGWGHVLASSLAETMQLSPQVTQVLETSLVKGALGRVEYLKRVVDDDDDEVREEDKALISQEQIMVVADAIVAVLSVALASGTRNDQSSPWEATWEVWKDVTILPLATFEQVWKFADLLPAVLGHLYHDRFIAIASLVVSIVVMAMIHKGSEADTQQRILDLLREEKLSSLWTDARLTMTASMASWLVSSYVLELQNDDYFSDEDICRITFQSMLKELRRINPKSCDDGIADAIAECSAAGAPKSRLATLLDGVVAIGVGKKRGGKHPSNEETTLLPPRVAMEHADALTRLQAIERVMKEEGKDEQRENERDDDGDEKYQGVEGHDDINMDRIETLEECLVRRFAVDEDAAVVLAAGSALSRHLAKKSSMKKLTSARFFEHALAALYKRTSFLPAGIGSKRKAKKEADPNVDTIVQSLTIAAYAAMGLQEHQTLTLKPTPLIEAIAAYLDHANASVRDAAATAVVRFLPVPAVSLTKKTDAVSLAKAALATNSTFIAGLKTRVTEGPDQQTAAALRRRCVWYIIEAMSGYLETSKNDHERVRVSRDAFDCCLVILQSKESKSLTDIKSEVLRSCLKLCAENMAENAPDLVPPAILALASIDGDKEYKECAERAIGLFAEKVCDDQHRTVSVYPVLMEATLLDNAPVNAVVRLLGLVTGIVSEGKHAEIWLCLVPTLSCLGNHVEKIRLAAIQLLAAIEKSSAITSCARWKFIHEICRQFTASKTSAAVGGDSLLTVGLASAVRSAGDPDTVRECIITLCLFSVTAYGLASSNSADESLGSNWLPFGAAQGSIKAFERVLGAMGRAGGDSFPLPLRWKMLGNPLLNKLLSTTVDDYRLPPSLSLLVSSTVKMLRGVCSFDSTSLESNSSNIIISSGPGAAGGRQRSYSVGNVDNARFIDVYPKTMEKALVEILRNAENVVNKPNAVVLQLCQVLLHDVVSWGSWSKSIFKRLSKSSKTNMATSMLRLAGSPTFDVPMSTFFGLPLDSPDLIHLLKKHSKIPEDLGPIAILADFVRINSESLMTSPAIAELLAVMFDLLDSLSRENDDFVGDVEFARQSILSAILDLISQDGADASNVFKSRVQEKKLPAWVTLLLALNGGDTSAEDNRVRPCPTQRAKSTSLSILTVLSKHFSTVVEALVPALTTTISAVNEMGPSVEKTLSNVTSTLNCIVPVFRQHAASAGLSLTNLLSAFVQAANQISGDTLKAGIYDCMASALVTASDVGPTEDMAVGALVAAFVACSMFTPTSGAGDAGQSDSSLAAMTDFALQVMESAPTPTQVSAILILLQYVDTVLLVLDQPDDITKSSPSKSSTSGDPESQHLPNADAIMAIALEGPSKEFRKLPSKTPYRSKLDPSERATIRKLVHALMLTANGALLMDTVQKFVQRSDRSRTALCLNLWQDLLVVQTTASNRSDSDGQEGGFWGQMGELADESLAQIQLLLPLPIFLASATTLIKEEESDDLRSRAVRLVADRAPELQPSSPEASLFLDMVALLVNLLKSAGTDDKESTIFQQSALVAVEHIARAHYGHPPGEVAHSGSHDAGFVFLSALDVCASIFERTIGRAEKAGGDHSGITAPSCQLICSAALCSAMLVRVTAPRCLSLLPKFMKHLISSLEYANMKASDSADAKLMQVCALRTLTSVADTLPQFLFPYLKQIFAPSVLTSEALRLASRESNSPAKAAIENLDRSLSSNVPARVLIPIVSKAVSRCTKPIEYESLIELLKASVAAASGEEIVGHMGPLMKALSQIFEYEGSFIIRDALLSSANDVLLSMVLKLSEVHLRKLYAILRVWRGDVDTDQPDKLALRRHAFWVVSAILSKELRTIFLPCLSTVISDAVNELNFAASRLCQLRLAETSGGGKKKRRLIEQGSGQLSADYLLSLQPLLRCLEYAFRADAYDGGEWVRSDDGQRYNALLDPLGKLLQSKIPTDFPVPSGVFAPDLFQYFVHGDGSGGGNVIGCLTSLAGAAGNEQLWKPLNHAVLDACSNSKRSEVRKAGLHCLHSLMKSLGEEYMVLLPECLPVLSELLEDSDEDVSGLAQDCVTLGEELLGESLEESLR